MKALTGTPSESEGGKLSIANGDFTVSNDKAVVDKLAKHF